MGKINNKKGGNGKFARVKKNGKAGKNKVANKVNKSVE
jgi:hypothetical protein